MKKILLALLIVMAGVSRCATDQITATPDMKHIIPKKILDDDFEIYSGNKKICTVTKYGKVILEDGILYEQAIIEILKFHQEQKKILITEIKKLAKERAIHKAKTEKSFNYALEILKLLGTGTGGR